MTAINANRYFGMNNTKLSKSLEKLSSGYAINRAGDNAAGLAVSEKMRAQISGINQGVKNAQDGISMVQTFEGALTETDSILQRMRTLATQSANGTYQNDVDREAIQLEYDQLNDELNQIADTDFNGVVVLNGGTMADGLKQVGGDFDYKNKASQLADTRATKLADLQAQLADIKNPKDIGAGATWKTVDDVAYTKEAADNLWKDLGIDSDKVASVDINFTVQEDGSFKATSAKAYDSANNELNIEIDLSKVTATAASKAGGTGKGGFTISSDSNNGDIANAIFDATDLNVGDAVAIKFTNTADKNMAPKNIGFTDDSANELDGKFSSKGDAKITLSTALTDETMSSDWKNVLEALEKATIDATYTAAATANGTALNTKTLAISDTTNFEIAADGKITLKKAFGSLGVGTEVATFKKDTEVKQLSSYATAGDVTVKYGIKLDTYTAADPTKTPDASKATGTPDTSVVDAKKASIQKQIDEIDKEGVSKSDSNDASTATLTYKDNITLQVGARTKDSVNFTFKYESNGLGKLKADMDCSARGLGTDKLSLATQEDANKAIDKIDNALNKVSMVRGTFGAVQNRLEHKIDNLNTTSENLTSAESRIRDTNMAEEMMNFTKNQILSQASQSMLAQANQLPQGVLSLLQ